jgi:hypothetical protein
MYIRDNVRGVGTHHSRRAEILKILIGGGKKTVSMCQSS